MTLQNGEATTQDSALGYPSGPSKSHTPATSFRGLVRGIALGLLLPLMEVLSFGTGPLRACKSLEALKSAISPVLPDGNFHLGTFSPGLPFLFMYGCVHESHGPMEPSRRLESPVIFA